jgi:hypothetical protein
VNAEKQFEILASKQEREDIDFNIMLDSIRRLAESEVVYNRALVGYAVALKNLHVETGDLMQYCNVQYSDGG